MTHPAWHLTLKLIMKRHVKMHLTDWMRSVILQRLVRRFTSKTCVVIIAVRLKLGPFKKEIWCSGSSRIKLMHTSYPHLGKGPLWSARTWTTGHTTLSMFESTKTHVSRRRRPTGRGILLIFGLITPEPPALVMYILCQCIMMNIIKPTSLMIFRASVISFLRIWVFIVTS